MKNINLVNAYALVDLFCELLFLEDGEVVVVDNDWADENFVKNIIRLFVVPRYDLFGPEKKRVISNTIEYLLSTKAEGDGIWDAIWQTASAPIPTPGGVKKFVFMCYQVIYLDKPLPEKESFNSHVIKHDMHAANLLK